VTKDVALTVPSYFTSVERQALLDSARIAGLDCRNIISESVATVLSYGHSRQEEFQRRERYVVFIDIGHSQTTVTYASFGLNGAQIHLHNSERNFGGRDLDYQVMEKLSYKYWEEH
jgi:heat shock protein 4